MKLQFVLLLGVLFSTPCLADDSTCDGIARSRLLAGPERKSFMTKCIRDAKVKCDADMQLQKLSGTDRVEHLKKCLREAVGG
jgi:hypothetical protein